VSSPALSSSGPTRSRISLKLVLIAHSSTFVRCSRVSGMAKRDDTREVSACDCGVYPWNHTAQPGESSFRGLGFMLSPVVAALGVGFLGLEFSKGLPVTVTLAHARSTRAWVATGKMAGFRG
jgi:hypothetical protein